MKALALISGGLDSILAARLIQNQGVIVTGIVFQIPFSPAAAPSISFPGLEIKYIDIKSAFLQLILNPRYGFGSHMNPCIDCKILMLNKARELMPQLGADFVVTGEVLGQRPMSQNRQALELIAKESGLKERLLRPLSAKLLEPTLPERQGGVKREELLGLSGRGRGEQIKLAEELKITGFSTPAGGCLLTDPAFSRRIKALLSEGAFDLQSIELLKLGRHFKLSERAKLITGRNEKENNALLEKTQQGDYLFIPPEDVAGPVSIGRGAFDDELIRTACAITCRYCDLDGKAQMDISYRKVNNSTADAGDLSCMNVVPLTDKELEGYRI